MTSTQPRSHRIAVAAYAAVDGFRTTVSEGGNAELAKQRTKAYSALAHKLPAMIQQYGLAQASGFLLAKARDNGKGEHRCVLAGLAKTMTAAGGVSAGDGTGESLHQQAIRADLHATMQLTRLALEASAWMRRYAQGVLDKDDDAGVDACADKEAGDVGTSGR